MIIKIRCSEAVGRVILRMFAAIEAVGEGQDFRACSTAIERFNTALADVAGNFRPEDLQFETSDDSSERTRGGGPRTKYWANLPTLPDGAFDMAAVDETVRRNLTDLKAHTVNGIIYQDIVAGTLAGAIVTEPRLARERMMKRGSSQRAVQVLFQMGLIDRSPITPEPTVEG